jgi:hypothetical protein
MAGIAESSNFSKGQSAERNAARSALVLQVNPDHDSLLLGKRCGDVRDCR